MGKRKDLTERERYAIEAYRNEKKSIKEIAVLLGRHYQTIYREIKRGTVEMLDSELRTYSKYCADTGQAIADRNKSEKGRELKIGNDLTFIRFIEQMVLEKRYSLEAILLHIKTHKLKFKTNVCLNTLYSYVDKGLFLNITNKHLPVKCNRKKRNLRKISTIARNNLKGRSIEERAKSIMKRKHYGHWEMDTVQGQKKKKGCILVLSERKTRQELLFKLDNKQCASVWNTLQDNWDKLKHHIKTITCDNGVEFSTNCEFSNNELIEFVRTNLYYCHPYRSGERGTNENQNKLIRRFYPKGVDLSEVTQEELKKIQDFINNMPRKIFNGLSSNQFLEQNEMEYLQT